MFGYRNSRGTFPEDIGKPNSVEESEAVDELLQILVDCSKRAYVRTREILLRKFFSEIEKEAAMESFVLKRIEQSKLSFLAESLEKISSGPQRQHSDVFEGRGVCSTVCKGVGLRGVISGDGYSGEYSMLRLGRFKIRTVTVGGIVEEEQAK